jgi:hypothetical protein
MVPSTDDKDYSVRVIKKIASSIGARAVNAKWTSYGALEMDVFAATRGDFDTFLGAIAPLGKLEFSRSLTEGSTTPFHTRDEVIQEARLLFNQERFWECHELIESQWRVETGDEKALLQGLILVCAALVHLQKGEDETALGIVGRAIPLLRWDGANDYHGLDVGLVRTRMVDALETHDLKPFRI